VNFLAFSPIGSSKGYGLHHMNRIGLQMEIFHLTLTYKNILSKREREKKKLVDRIVIKTHHKLDLQSGIIPLCIILCNFS